MDFVETIVCGVDFDFGYVHQLTVLKLVLLLDGCED